MNRTILITGPMGSGKSEICRYLASKGFPVYDSDSRTKALYTSVPGLLEKLEDALGVPYSKFGIIFSDAGKRRTLEEMVYPVVYEDMACWKASLGHYNMAFIESATAGEKPLFRPLYDGIWYVSAPAGIRHSRNPRARERDVAQNFNPADADRIIENNGSIEDLHKKIDELL